MQTGRVAGLHQPNNTRVKAGAWLRLGCANTSLLCGARHVAVKGFGTKVSESFRPATGQKDVTAELLERAFSLALTTRLKQHSGIHIDVRSTAWGLMEGKFGGMTVHGYKWRTPLELTAEQLTVDVGELVLDYQKLMWQQTVSLKNVPQGSVAFTLSSLDLANFMVHPIMVAAASRAIKGHAFLFDRSTARVSLDPGTGCGVITYEGVWAADGQRYAITMSTPPAKPATASATATSGSGVASGPASFNTLEQLAVSARRVAPTTAAGRSSTGSYASIGSLDEPLAAATTAAAAAAAITAAVASTRSGSTMGRAVQTLTVAPPLEYGTTTSAADVGAEVLSAASAGSIDTEVDVGAEVVAEGLRRFFSSLVLNLQGIELRNPVLLVQLPGKGVGTVAGGLRSGTAQQPRLSGPGALSGVAAGSSAPTTTGTAAVESSPGKTDLLPALLTITMKLAILQLPPLNMKF